MNVAERPETLFDEYEEVRDNENILLGIHSTGIRTAPCQITYKENGSARLVEIHVSETTNHDNITIEDRQPEELEAILLEEEQPHSDPVQTRGDTYHRMHDDVSTVISHNVIVELYDALKHGEDLVKSSRPQVMGRLGTVSQDYQTVNDTISYDIEAQMARRYKAASVLLDTVGEIIEPRAERAEDDKKTLNAVLHNPPSYTSEQDARKARNQAEKAEKSLKRLQDNCTLAASHLFADAEIIQDTIPYDYARPTNGQYRLLEKDLLA
jgi:hypothetical protein